MSLGCRDTLGARKPGLCSWGGGWGCLAGLERTLVSFLSITFMIIRCATRHHRAGHLGSQRTCLVLRTPGTRAKGCPAIKDGVGWGVSEPGGPIREGMTPQRQCTPGSGHC